MKCPQDNEKWEGGWGVARLKEGETHSNYQNLFRKRARYGEGTVGKRSEQKK